MAAVVTRLGGRRREAEKVFVPPDARSVTNPAG
jgi:hypothetical protein